MQSEPRGGPALQACLEEFLSTPFEPVARVIPDEQATIEATLRELVALALHGHTYPCVEKLVSALLQQIKDSLLPPWMAVELNVPAAVRVRCGHARQTSKELAWRLADEALHGQPWEDASAADRAEVLWELRAMEMDTKDLLRAPLPSPTGTSASLVCAAVLLGVPGFHESETEDVAEPLAEARRLYAEEPDALEAVRLAVDVPLVSKRLSDEEGVWAVALALVRDREPEVERLGEASEHTKKEVLQLLHLSCHEALARVLLAPTDTVPYTLRAMAFAQTVLPPPEGLPVALQETLRATARALVRRHFTSVGLRVTLHVTGDDAIWDTIAWVARLEGLLLDPVYTGKAMHALLCEVRAGRWTGPILFWHTGGAFGLFGRGHELPA